MYEMLRKNSIQDEIEEENNEDEIEFGTANYESVEYKNDIIIQEIESGVYLGPALRLSCISDPYN